MILQMLSVYVGAVVVACVVAYAWGYLGEVWRRHSIRRSQR